MTCRLREERRVQKFQVFGRAFIEVDCVRRVGKDLGLLEIGLGEEHLVDLEQRPLIVDEQVK